MTRDFSDSSKQILLELVSEVEHEKMSDFTDWMGDRWYDFQSWIGILNIKGYINHVNDYHKKVIDKNNTTRDAIQKIFQDVNKVNISYTSVFENLNALIEKWEKYIESMNIIITPENGKFTSSAISTALEEIYKEIKTDDIEAIKNNMKHTDINGNVSYDIDVIESYLRSGPEEITDNEKEALLEIINELSELRVHYSDVLSLGDENAAAYLAYLSSYSDDEETYANFVAAGAYYDDVYLKVLNAIAETGKDSGSFSASLLSLGSENVDASILGLDGSAQIDRFLKYIPVAVSADLSAYILKVERENAELYAGRVTIAADAKSAADVSVKGLKKDELKKKENP